MSSETDIANLALVPLLGCNKITSLSDESTEAIVMNASYTYCRDTVLEARAWTFATTRAAWIPTVDTIPFGFTYSYLIPSTTLKLLTVSDQLNGLVRDNFHWEREEDRVITDAAKVYVRYISRVTNTDRFSSGYINALSLYLAWYNCIALTENTPLKDSLWVKYENALVDASTADGMQGRKERFTSNSLISVR